MQVYPQECTSDLQNEQRNTNSRSICGNKTSKLNQGSITDILHGWLYDNVTATSEDIKD